MKKILLPCTLFLVLNNSSLLAQIPNAGFENWSTVGSYMNPDNWSTMNNTTATYSLFTATKATPGNPGTAYLKLTSKTINGSVVKGIAVSGKLDTINLKPISGFPYTQRSSTFAGKWQHMIYGASQGNVSVLLSRWNTTTGHRDTVASAAVTLAGMAMSWSNFGMSLNYVDSLHYPDSCLIVLQASGTAPTNNDYLWVDALALTGTVALAPPAPPANLVGINENTSFISNLSVFPNPAQHQLNLSYTLQQADKVSIQLIDIHGKVVIELPAITAQSGSNTIHMETSGLSHGQYILKIASSKGIQNKKIILN